MDTISGEITSSWNPFISHTIWIIFKGNGHNVVDLLLPVEGKKKRVDPWEQITHLKTGH